MQTSLQNTRMSISASHAPIVFADVFEMKHWYDLDARQNDHLG